MSAKADPGLLVELLESDYCRIEIRRPVAGGVGQCPVRIGLL